MLTEQILRAVVGDYDQRQAEWLVREHELLETIETYESNSAQFAVGHWKADLAPFLEPFVELIPDQSLPIVDAGCGAGRDIAAFVGLGFRCIGVDRSRQMLDRARERLQCASVTWHESDIRRMPVGSGSAGALWSVAAILHLDAQERRQALREFHRILAPGRPAFVSTLLGDGPSSRMTPSGGRRHFWGTSADELSESLREAGFEVLSTLEGPGVVGGQWINVVALRRM